MHQSKKLSPKLYDHKITYFAEQNIKYIHQGNKIITQ
uniref:Uncharacterized protein n=1 Tax=Anguilla anguilla TaxID=7936 RepID=A0A0E9QSK8_ANGAN